METRYYVCKIIGTGAGWDAFRPAFADLGLIVPKWTAFDLRAIGNETSGLFMVKVEATPDDHIRIKKTVDVVEIGNNFEDLVIDKTKISNLVGKTIVGTTVKEVCRSLAELNPNLKKEVKVWGEI